VEAAVPVSNVLKKVTGSPNGFSFSPGKKRQNQLKRESETE